MSLSLCQSGRSLLKHFTAALKKKLNDITGLELGD